MAWDDPKVNRPLTLADLGPAPPAGAEESFALTLAYTPRDGAPAAREFKTPKLTLKQYYHDRKKPDAWPKELKAQRAQVDAAWTALAPEREWFAALDRFEMIGDATAPRLDAPLLKFHPFRTTLQMASAQATLLAMDGRGDEAIDLLLPYIRVCYKLEPASRTLMRSAIARSGLGLTLDTARYVVDHGNVSPEGKARLAAVLREASATEPLLRRMMMLEYAFAYEGMLSNKEFPLGKMALFRGGSLQAPFAVALNVLDPVLYLRRATANLYARQAEAMADLAVKRDLAEFDRQGLVLYQQINNAPLKNIGGIAALDLMLPSYLKVVETFLDGRGHPDQAAGRPAAVSLPRQHGRPDPGATIRDSGEPVSVPGDMIPGR